MSHLALEAGNNLLAEDGSMILLDVGSIPVSRDAYAAPVTTTNSTLNLSHTVGTGANLLILAVNLGAATANGAGTVTATAVKNGIDTAMSTDTSTQKLATGSGDHGFIQIFTLVNPDSGTNVIKATRAGGSGVQDLILASVTYNNAGIPIFTKGVPNTGTLASVTFSVANNDLALSCCAAGNSITTTSDTKLTNIFVNSNSGAGSQCLTEKTLSTGSITMTDTIPGTDYYGAIGVKIPSG